MNPLCCIAPVSIDRGDATAVRPKPVSLSSKGLLADAAAVEVEEREAAAMVVGIMYKWVNYGKGWRARWFVLRDGVLSYYKVHGPDKISVGMACEGGGVRVIGEDSVRRLRKERYWGSVGGGVKEWKTFGEIHLKVRFLF